MFKNALKGTGGRKSYIGLLYIAPWLIGLIGLQLYPILMSLYYSFTDYNLLSDPSFVGFANYIKIFTVDAQALKAFGVTLKYVLMTIPAKILFALIIAILMSKHVKGIKFFRTAYYIPSILGGSVAVCVLWRLLFQKDGVFNAFTGLFGIEPVNWLGNTSTALIIVALLSVWQFGSSMVLFLAALNQVPQELREAVRIDGGNKRHEFFKVTLPSISPVLFFNIITQTINCFQEFTAVFAITKGGPMNSTYLIAMKIYDEAFKHMNMGYAAAISWVLFIIILAVTVLLFATSKFWVHYED